LREHKSLVIKHTHLHAFISGIFIKALDAAKTKHDTKPEIHIIANLRILNEELFIILPNLNPYFFTNISCSSERMDIIDDISH
jgi:hypothetical protein